MTNEDTKWIGDSTCDVCGETEHHEEGYFVDAVHISGQWAVMCAQCHREVGMYSNSFGTGRGQKYDWETKEKLDG